MDHPVKHMTFRQFILKALYPVFSGVNRLLGKNLQILSSDAKAPHSFYGLKAMSNRGEELDFQSLKGKKVLLVNTASNCGYTKQYKALEKLHEANVQQLVVIAFPANDFKAQEKYDDQAIAAFCSVSYHLTFPVMKKGKVLKHSSQQDVYKWLTDRDKNGWNDQAPTWNFCKYLVDEEGNLTHFFEASIEPLGKQIGKAIRPG
jgi:glutathione peroxidase